MPAQLIEQKGNTLTVQFTVALTGQMLWDEQSLQQVLNEAGQIAMGPMLKQFDTQGEPIRVHGVKHTVKDYAPQTYETPYGPVQVERHTYQTSQGGRAYVPLEQDARMVLNSTPRYAQIALREAHRFWGAKRVRYLWILGVQIMKTDAIFRPPTPCRDGFSCDTSESVVGLPPPCRSEHTWQAS